MQRTLKLFTLQALAALSLLTACGDKDITSDTGSSSETGLSADICAARDVETCEEDDLCVTTYAREMIDDGAGGLCTDYSVEPEPMDCVPADSVCLTVLTYDAPPDDPSNCWEFSAGCAPEDWVSCAEPTSTCR